MIGCRALVGLVVALVMLACDSGRMPGGEVPRRAASSVTASFDAGTRASLAGAPSAVAAPPAVVAAPPAAAAPENDAGSALPPVSKPAVTWRAVDGHKLPRALRGLSFPERRERGWSNCAERQIELDGRLRDEPVHATLTLDAKRFTLDVAHIPEGGTERYRGRWKDDVCVWKDEHEGRMVSTDAKHSTLAVSLFMRGSWTEMPSGSEGQVTSGGRALLELEGHDDAEDSPTLALWEAADDPEHALAPYRAALRAAIAFGAAVRAPDGATLLAYMEPGSGTLELAELAGSPLVRRSASTTSLGCLPTDFCTAKLSGFEVAPGIVLLVVRLAGSGSRGQGNFDTDEAELWVLTSDGFTLGAALPAAESSDTAHGTVREQTKLYWVDAGGAMPPDILAIHRADSPGTLLGNDMLPGWKQRDVELFSFSAIRGTYEKVEVPSGVSDAVMAQVTRGAGFIAY